MLMVIQNVVVQEAEQGVRHEDEEVHQVEDGEHLVDEVDLEIEVDEVVQEGSAQVEVEVHQEGEGVSRLGEEEAIDLILGIIQWDYNYMYYMTCPSIHLLLTPGGSFCDPLDNPFH
jgi:hypothetical protein